MSKKKTFSEKMNDPDYEWEDGDDSELFEEGYQEGYEQGYQDSLLAMVRTIFNLHKIDLSRVDWAKEYGFGKSKNTK